MEKYWLTLYPDTFLWVKGETGLIYNAKDHASCLFEVCGKIEKLCNELSVLENLYTISISGEDLVDDKVQQWIQSVIEINAAFLTPDTGTEKKPVSLKPVLKIQDKTDYYQWKHQKGIGGDIVRNLHELTFFINGSQSGSDAYFRQTLFPLKQCSQLEMKKILTFARYSRNPYLSKINIVGNLFAYPDYHTLIDGLAELAIPHTIYITLQDLMHHIKQFSEIQWSDHSQFTVLVETLPEKLVPLPDFQIPIKIHALVFSEADCLSISGKFDNLPIYYDHRKIPVYNGSNLDFFESQVFTGQEELDNLALSKHEIFIRQTLNIHSFGKLTVMPDGKVYANVNHKPLGTMDDTVYELVYKELTERQSWLQIRNQAPCTDCVYQWLCPSPSNYETVIEKPNLCNVRQ